MANVAARPAPQTKVKFTRAELERGFIPSAATTHRSFISADDRSIRRGRVFTLRLEPEEEKILRERFAPFMREWNPFGYNRRASFGAFLVTAALRGSEPQKKKEPSAQAKRMIAKASKKKRR